MSTLTDLLTHDHRQCDAAFASIEHHLRQPDWAAVDNALAAFGRALESHFGAEEEILFPRFEEATGMTQGPTAVMREEHREMRAALARMAAALAAHDAEEYGGEAETLLILMQQHNMKEENILYPLCDRHLHGEREHLGLSIGHRLEGVPQ